MRTLALLLFGLLIASKTGLCQNNEEYDYNNDEDEYPVDDEEEEDGREMMHASILSSRQDLVVNSGTKVSLPCKTDIEGGLIEWYFGHIRIYMDGVKMITEPRYNMVNDGLVIDNVTDKDSGNYSCVLVEEKKYLNHTISVTSPVKIVDFTTTRDNLSVPDRSHTSHAIWLKGSRQKVHCNAVGFPAPHVVLSHMWVHGKHKSGQIESLVGNPVTIDPVERKHAGKYICTASNENTKVDKTIQVEVEYPPEIHMKKDYITAAAGLETVITCRVQAHPPASVHWERTGKRVDRALREMMEDREGANHILRIPKTSEADFGNYTCMASNSLGAANKTVRVSGEPSRPVIQSATFDDDSITPVLTWKIESQVPVVEYKLEYKKQENNQWYEVKKVAEADTPDNDEDSNYMAKHKFDDLEEGTYHARIKAKNIYGWSENSIEKTFSGNKELTRAANTYSQLESVRQNSATEVTTSLAFVLSLLAARLLH